MVTVYHRVKIKDIQFEKRVHTVESQGYIGGGGKVLNTGSNIFGIEQNHSQVTMWRDQLARATLQTHIYLMLFWQEVSLQGM